MSYQSGGAAAAAVSAVTVRKNLAGGADFNVTPTAATKLDASLDCTLTVPASGNVLVAMDVLCFNAAADNSILRIGVQVDGAGAVTWCGAVIFSDGAGHTYVGGGSGGTPLTGLSPGSHTFSYMIQNQNNGGTQWSFNRGTGGSGTGTWMSVTTQP